MPRCAATDKTTVEMVPMNWAVEVCLSVESLLSNASGTVGVFPRQIAVTGRGIVRMDQMRMIVGTLLVERMNSSAWIV
jgi:hypothetical protein